MPQDSMISSCPIDPSCHLPASVSPVHHRGPEWSWNSVQTYSSPRLCLLGCGIWHCVTLLFPVHLVPLSSTFVTFLCLLLLVPLFSRVGLLVLFYVLGPSIKAILLLSVYMLWAFKLSKVFTKVKYVHSLKKIWLHWKVLLTYQFID